MVYGETSGTIQNVRNAPLSSRRILSEEEFKPYGEKLTLFAEWCYHEGMPISFHHHMGTAIETERDLDLLMRNSDKTVSLLYDPGHMAFANGNVYEIIERHGHRISHFHAKDVRSNIAPATASFSCNKLIKKTGTINRTAVAPPKPRSLVNTAKLKLPLLNIRN